PGTGAGQQTMSFDGEGRVGGQRAQESGAEAEAGHPAQPVVGAAAGEPEQQQGEQESSGDVDREGRPRPLARCGGQGDADQVAGGGTEHAAGEYQSEELRLQKYRGTPVSVSIGCWHTISLSAGRLSPPAACDGSGTISRSGGSGPVPRRVPSPPLPYRLRLSAWGGFPMAVSPAVGARCAGCGWWCRPCSGHGQGFLPPGS